MSQGDRASLFSLFQLLAIQSILTTNVLGELPDAASSLTDTLGIPSASLQDRLFSCASGRQTSNFYPALGFVVLAESRRCTKSHSFQDDASILDAGYSNCGN